MKTAFLAAALVLAASAAQAQYYTTTPDGFGGSRTWGTDGSRWTTTPDGFGGSRTYVQSPPQYDPRNDLGPNLGITNPFPTYRR